MKTQSGTWSIKLSEFTSFACPVTIRHQLLAASEGPAKARFLPSRGGCQSQASFVLRTIEASMDNRAPIVWDPYPVR